MPWARRSVLTYVQSRLQQSLGIVLEAKNLDYNLLVPRFQLEQVSMRFLGKAGQPPILKAERVSARLRYWDLITGSATVEQVSADGLTLQWIIDKEGRDNLPEMGPKSSGSGLLALPVRLLEITNVTLSLSNERANFFVRLPQGTIHSQYLQANGEQPIHYSTRQAGMVRWNGEELPLDQFSLESVLRRDSFEIHSLNLVSANSRIHARGRLDNFDKPDLKFLVNSDVDCEPLAKWMRSSVPVSGRMKGVLNGAGALDAIRLNARLVSDRLALAGLRWERVAASFDYDRQSKVVRIEELAAGIFSGRIGARGQIDTSEKETSSALSIEVVHADLRQAASALGWKVAPQGVAEARLSLAWPGRQWQRLQVNAVGKFQPVRKATPGLDSPLVLVGNAQNRNGLVRIKIDSVSVPGAVLQGNVSLKPDGTSLEGMVHGNIHSLAQFSQSLENLTGHPAGFMTSVPIDGAAELTASLAGTAKRPLVSADIRANSLSAPGFTDANLQLQANYSPDSLELKQALLQWHGQSATASGSIELGSTPTPWHLEARLDQVSISETASVYGVHPEVSGTVSGRLSLIGSPSSPVASLTIATDGLNVYGEPLGQLTSEIILRNQKVTVNRLHLEKPQSTGTGIAEGRGVFDLTSHEYEIELNGRNLQVTTLKLPGSVSLVGMLDLKVTGKGVFDNPSAQLELEARELQVAEYPVGDLKVGAQLDNHHAAVDLKAPSLHLLAKAGVGTQGSYPIQFEISDSHTPLNLARGGNILGTGFFDAQIKGNGLLSSIENLEASASVRNLQLTLLGQEIRNSQPIEMGYADQHLNILNFALESGESRVQLSGGLPLRSDTAASEIAIKAQLQLATLSGLLPTAKSLKAQGAADLNAALRGNLSQPKLSGLLTLRDGRVQIEAIPSPVMNLGAELETENGLMSLKTLSATLGDGTIRASGSWPLALLRSGRTFGSEPPTRSAQFSIQAEKIPWSSLLAVQENTSGYFSVNISGDASQLTFRGLNARAQFGEILVKQEKYELNQAVPTILTLSHSQLQVEQFRWKGPQTELRVAGTVGLAADHPLDLRFSGDADASLAQLFIPTLQASGPARVDLGVGGTAHALLLSGYVEASKATLGLRSPRLLGEDIALRIDLKGDRIDLTKLIGTLNGGTLQGTGGAAWRDGRLDDVKVDLKGQDVFLNYPTGFKTASDLDLQIRSRGRSIEVGGKVEVREGSYHEPFDLGMISGSTAQSIRTSSGSGPPAVGFDVLYNIELRTKQPIDVDNNLARFYASADLKLAGTVRQPGLLGTVVLEPGGKLYFGNRTYIIEQGVVTFTNESRVDPLFDVFATARVKDYEIGLRLTGTLKDSETTFTSDPPLSRDDIISVLLTGKTVSESGGTGIDPSQAGTYSLATGAMNVSLSGKMRRAIGVSQVSIEPGLIAAESNPGARLTIGQDLTRNLRLVYSMNLTNSSDQIWIAEYDFRRRFVARVVQQSSDTDRVEFRHDLRFGGSPNTQTGTGARKAPKRKVGRVEFGGNPSLEEARLSKEFKVKSGDKYDFVKVRKGVERLEKFYSQKGYLESRVRLQTAEHVETVDLSVHLEAGRKVRLIYEGTALPKSVKKNVRQEWQTSVSDVQRSEDATQAIQVHLAKEGYLHAQVSSRTGEGADDEKTVLFDITPGIRFRNVATVFEGLGKPEAEELLQFLERRNLKDAVYSDPRLLAETVTRYFQQRGYLLAKVALPEYQLDAEARTGRVVVPVTKGPEFTIAALRFTGNTRLTDTQLKSKLPISEGTVFDQTQVQPALATLKEQYGRSGFRNAEVDYELVRNDIKSAVEIRFTIQEKLKSVIQSVKIEGEDKVSEKFIRRQIEFSEGETQDTSEANRSIRRLYSTGTFARVDLQSEPLPDLPASAQGVEPVNVIVRVQETRPYKFVYGGYFDSDRGPGVITELEARNLLGSARLLGLRARVDRDYQEGRFYVTQPPLRQLPLQSTITGYWKSEIVNNVYNLETLGSTVQQEGRLREKFLFSYGYRYERKQVFFIADPIFQNFHYSVAPLLATLSRTSRDDYLDPTRGSFTSHALEFAPEALGSTFGYVRYFGQYFKYFPISQPRYVPFGGETKRPRFIYATGLRVGLMNGLTRNDIVPSERFFAGGGTTVRGFEQDKLGPLDRFGNPLGGNAMLVINNELRFPFVSILDAVGFVDIGNVYPKISDFSFSDLRKTAGFGLRLRTPFLMIRFDYGFKLDRLPGESPGAFFFSIGQAF